MEEVKQKLESMVIYVLKLFCRDEEVKLDLNAYMREVEATQMKGMDEATRAFLEENLVQSIVHIA